MTNANSSSNRLTCPHCPKHKTKRYKGEAGLADHIRAVHSVPAFLGSVADLLDEVISTVLGFDGDVAGIYGDDEDDDNISRADVYRHMRKERVEQGERNRQSAEQEFQEAEHLAAQHGMTLKKIDPTQYQLIGPDNSLINIYPGNQRLYVDPNRPRPPYLKLSEPWTLLDVVKAAGGVV